MDVLIKNLSIYLDTRDKRFMFLKIFFPVFVYKIDLEGSPRNAAMNIYKYFDKNDSLEDLEKHFSETFLEY